MKKVLLLLICLICKIVIGQVAEYKMPEYHPTSPTAFQFLKYTEMPVSEYTGRPNIEVPFYTIQEGNIKLPIALSYHAGGIRVDEEASWVGLGWDMQVGSIVQQVNDVDDYPNAGEYSFPVLKRLPDYFAAGGDGAPNSLPIRFMHPYLTPSAGYQNPYPIQPIQNRQGYAIATDYFVPVNGDFNSSQASLFTDPWADSEPDIFTATVLGETVKFIQDFKNNGQIKVLNNEGFKVSKTILGFKVINPDGIICYFEKISEIRTSTSVINFETYGNSSGSSGQLTSKVFFLTKVVSALGKVVELEYNETAPFQGLAVKGAKLHLFRNSQLSISSGISGGYEFSNYDSDAPAGASGDFSFPSTSSSTNTEKFIYLKRITFSAGKIDFVCSDRLDMAGNKKLDKITVTNYTNHTIKDWKLNYNYFDITNSQGLQPSAKRLKLENINENDISTYYFHYNSIQLPL